MNRTKVRDYFFNLGKVHVPCYACHTQAHEKKFACGKHSKWTSTYKKVKKLERNFWNFLRSLF